MKKKSTSREWIDSIVVAGILAVLLRTFLFQIYKIPTTSMVPTLLPKDKIFVTKLVYGPKVPFTKLRISGVGKPQRGDVIVFVPPHDRKKTYIKRLVGLEGDRILIRDGKLYIDGEEVSDPRMSWIDYANQGRYAREGKEVVVPEGKYFFLGDNSDNSQDSRFWGFADQEDIVGKALFIWWPPKRIGKIN